MVDSLVGLAILLVIALIFIVGFSVGYIIGQMSVSREYYRCCDQGEMIEIRRKLDEYERKDKDKSDSHDRAGHGSCGEDGSGDC